MANKYNHFEDGEMSNAERLANEARDNAELARLQWQDRVEDRLVIDMQNIIMDLVGQQISPLERAWRTNMALKMRIHDFAVGILYAQEKLG